MGNGKPIEIAPKIRTINTEIKITSLPEVPKVSTPKGKINGGVKIHTYRFGTPTHFKGSYRFDFNPGKSSSYAPPPPKPKTHKGDAPGSKPTKVKTKPAPEPGQSPPSAPASPRTALATIPPKNPFNRILWYAKQLKAQGKPELAALLTLPPVTIFLGTAMYLGESLASMVEPFINSGSGLAPATVGAWGEDVCYPEEDPSHIFMQENLQQDGGGEVSRIDPAFEPFEDTLMESDIFGISYEPGKEPEQLTVRVEANSESDLSVVALAVSDHLPPGVEKINIVTDGKPDALSLEKLIRVSKENGITVSLGKEITNGHTEWVPHLEIINGEVRVHDRQDALELLSQALDQKEKITITDSKGKLIGKVEEAPMRMGLIATLEGIGTIRYKRVIAGPSPLTIKIEPKATKEQIGELIKITDGIGTSPYQWTAIEIHGINLEKSPHADAALNPLVENALWGGARSIKIGSQIEIKKWGYAGKTGYDISSGRTSFEHIGKIHSTFDAFKVAKAMGEVSPESARYQELKAFFRAAMHQAVMFNNYNTKDKLEYPGWNYSSTMWNSAVNKMMEFSKDPKKKELLNKVLDAIKKYSQPKEGHLLGFSPFDGRAYADNALELLRIMSSGIYTDPSVLLTATLGLFGPQGSVEINGAVMGIIFKSSIPVNGKTDSAAIHELDRLLEMRQQAMATGDRYRITVIPEDYYQGMSFGTASYTPTPEWLLEKLDKNGDPFKVLSVEATNLDASYTNQTEVTGKIKKKVFQVLDHKFSQGINRGDSLIIFKFYHSEGMDSLLLSYVQEALRVEFNIKKKKRPKSAKKMKRLRVQIIFEDKNYIKGARTVLLEYNHGKDSWIPRSDGGSTTNSGTTWSEPINKVMGW